MWGEGGEGAGGDSGREQEECLRGGSVTMKSTQNTALGRMALQRRRDVGVLAN